MDRNRRFLPFVPLLMAGLLAACGGDSAPDPVRPDPNPQPGPPDRLTWVGGASTPETAFGSVFPDSIQLWVQDANGLGVPGLTLSVEVPAGGGWVSNPTPVTNAQGRASWAWYAGSDPASPTQRLRVRAGNRMLELEGRARLHQAQGRLSGHRGFVEYTPGTLPLILTAAHGGTLLPADIPDRTVGTVVRDLDTDTLAILTAQAIEARTGARPHLILVRLHRRKLDANREIVEAAQGNREAERGWREFHGWTEAAVAQVRAQHPRGFYLDIHGHGHDLQRLEIGTLLSASDLDLADSALNGPTLAAKSSLRSLASWSGRSPAEVLRGPKSPGALFEARGYPAVPSPTNPSPGSAPFFSGGYNTVRYGCQDGGRVCGFQLEAHRIGVRDSGPALQAFAEATAEVLLELMADYGITIPKLPPQPAR